MHIDAKGIDRGLMQYILIFDVIIIGSGDDTEMFRGLGLDVAFHGEDPEAPAIFQIMSSAYSNICLDRTMVG